MKKILLFATLVMTLLIPMRIKAVSITSESITGSKEKTIGEEFPLTFKVNFSGLEKGQDKTIGIWVLDFNLEFDEKVFGITGISSSNFNSLYFKENGKQYIYSEVPASGTSTNNCANGELYCGNYEVTINFVVKNTNERMSTIAMKEVEVALLNMNDPNKEEYTLEDDAILLNGTSSQFHTITITPSAPTTTTPKEITASNNVNPQKKSQKNPTTNTEIKNQNSSKSSDASLKSLEVENYKLNFQKKKKEYTVYIDEGVNSLNIKAETYDSKAKYKVIGADDLKANNNKVSIEVTAEDNTKDTYTINVKVDGELKKKMQEKMSKEDTPKETKKEKSKISKKTLTNIGIGVGVIAFLGIVVFIIFKIKNRKMDKMLDEL